MNLEGIEYPLTYVCKIGLHECNLQSTLPEAHCSCSRKRTKSHVFALSSTDLRLESNKIFPVDAITLLRVPVQRRIGASHRRFNVSTAFRGAYLLYFAFKPTCYNHNVLIAAFALFLTFVAWEWSGKELMKQSPGASLKTWFRILPAQTFWFAETLNMKQNRLVSL